MASSCKENFAHRLFTLRDVIKNTFINMALRDGIMKARLASEDFISAVRRDLKHTFAVARVCEEVRKLGWRYARSDHSNAYDVIAWKDDETIVFIEVKSYRPPWAAENTLKELLAAPEWKVERRLVFAWPTHYERIDQAKVDAVLVRDLYEYQGKVYATQSSIKPLREVLQEVERLRRV